MSVSRAAKIARANQPRSAPKTRARPQPSNVTLMPDLEIRPITVEQWQEASPEMRLAILQNRNNKAEINAQKEGEDSNLIDWAKWSWNPITGCLHDCPYCYARDIAERFKADNHPAFPNGFIPTLRPERLSAPARR